MDIISAIKFNNQNDFINCLKNNDVSGLNLIENIVRFERIPLLKIIHNYLNSGQYDKRGYKKNDSACLGLHNAFNNLAEIILKTEKFNMIKEIVHLDLVNSTDVLKAALKNYNHKAIEYLFNNFFFSLETIIEEVLPAILKKDDKKSFLSVIKYLNKEKGVFLNINNNPALYQIFIHRDKYYFETLVEQVPNLEITSIYYKEKNSNYFTVLPNIMRNTSRTPLSKEFYLQHLFGSDLIGAGTEEVLACFDLLNEKNLISYEQIIAGIKAHYSKNSLEEYQYYIDSLEAKIDIINLDSTSLDAYSKDNQS